MKRTLWGRSDSSNVMKVVWLLEEGALPYERMDVGGAFGRTEEPFYREMNPNSLVPTLQEEDGFTLWESNVILRYLANREPVLAHFYPAEARARANVERWMDWTHTTLGPPHSVVFQGLVRTPPEKRDNGAIEAAMGRVIRAYTVLDAQLGEHAHIAGPDFSLADITNGVHVHRWFSLPLRRPDLPHLRRWYDGLLARTPYRTHCAKPMT